MKKKIAFFDFDNTLCAGYTLSAFYMFLIEKDISKHAAEVLEKDNYIDINFRKLHTITYNQATVLALENTGLSFKGLTVKELETAAAAFATNYAQNFYSYTKPLLTHLQKQGYEIYIISASTKFLVAALLKQLDIYLPIIATNFEVKNEIYTGKIQKNLNGEAKLEAVTALIQPEDYTIAFGDSEGDLEMLQTVNQGYLINFHDEKLLPVVNASKIKVITDTTVESIIGNIPKNY